MLLSWFEWLENGFKNKKIELCLRADIFTSLEENVEHNVKNQSLELPRTQF